MTYPLPPRRGEGEGEVQVMSSRWAVNSAQGINTRPLQKDIYEHNGSQVEEMGVSSLELVLGPEAAHPGKIFQQVLLTTSSQAASNKYKQNKTRSPVGTGLFCPSDHFEEC